MTLTQITAYHRPGSLGAAWERLRDGDGTVRLLGGGTDLVVGCPSEVRELVDLADTGLRYVRDDEVALRIGAMTTFTDLLEHPATAAHAGGVLRVMLAQVGSVLHRNSATIGGHLARARLSDVVPVLVALDATVVTYDGHEHETAVADHLASPRGPEIIAEVRLPAVSRGSLAAFERFSRAHFDHAMVNACCRVDLVDAEVVEARVVVGESAVLGRRVPPSEQALRGGPLDDAAITAAVAATEDLDTRGDWVASAEYRRQLAAVAVERCLRSVAAQAGGAA